MITRRRQRPYLNSILQYRSLIDFGQTIGPFASHCLAHVQTFSQHRRTPDVRFNAPVHMNTPEKGNAMNTGTVKFYNDQKGFGFIQPDNGGTDVFVHATALERAGIRGLREGQKVSFDTEKDSRSGKIAVNNIQEAK
jgi:cold shock protein